MSFDWVPGAGLAVIGCFLGLWRGSAVMEEKVKELHERHVALGESLRERLQAHEHAQEMLEESVHGQITEAVKELNQIATQLKVTIAEQSAFNRVNTKTLEGLVQRMELMDARWHEHDKQIAVLKAGE